MRIAVDVMGGDHGPGVVVSGVGHVLAAPGSENISAVYLVGHEDEIARALAEHHCSDPRLNIVHASQCLTMEDDPLVAIRRKKDSSVVRAVALVSDGKADAVMSLGNTGGLVAAATFGLGRMDGVKRPAIATVMPTVTSHFVLLDAGASPECEPLHLFHFAIMGSVYAREILGIKNPRVALLSNGSEEFKGTELTRGAAELCKRSPVLNFTGYVEGTDIFADRVDVVVTDGFVGNIVLKTAEGLGKTIIEMLRRELTATPLRALGAKLAQSGFRTLKRKMDPEAHGGARLIGLNGIVVKVHGSAKERVVANAVRQLGDAVNQHVTEHMSQEILRANELVTAPA